MMEDLAKTIKAQLYERLNSPLVGALAISWCAWNYKFLIVLFSNIDPEKKLELIQRTIFVTEVDVWMSGIAMPTIMAAVYLFVYPWPARWVYQYVRLRHKELKEVQQRIDDETPITREEAREIRRAALKADLEFSTELQKKDDEIQHLKHMLAEHASGDGKPDQKDKLEEIAKTISEMQQRMNSFNREDKFKVDNEAHGQFIQRMLSDYLTNMNDLNADNISVHIKEGVAIVKISFSRNRTFKANYEFGTNARNSIEQEAIRIKGQLLHDIEMFLSRQ